MSLQVGPHRIGWVTTSGHRSSAWAVCRQANRPCGQWPSPPCQAALRPRRRRRPVTAVDARADGGIGWQLLLMLARAADCARVTKQYELVRKAEISLSARRGTSGVRGPTASVASQRRPGLSHRPDTTAPCHPDTGEHFPTFGEPKTARGNGSLPAQTVAALRGHHKAQAATRLLAGPDYIDHGLVFAEPDGSPIHPEILAGKIW